MYVPHFRKLKTFIVGKYSQWELFSPIRSVRIGFVPTVPARGYRVYKILEREPKHLRYELKKHATSIITDNIGISYSSLS